MSTKTRDFPTATQLKNANDVTFQLFIPSTRDRNKEISQIAFNKRINNTVARMSKLFGGSTIDIETGTYQLKGKTIKEPVAVITVTTTQVVYNKYDEFIRDWIRQKKQTWGQDSMGFVYQGNMVFV